MFCELIYEFNNEISSGLSWLFYHFNFTDQTHIAREKARADAEFYTMEKQAAANKVLYTYM